MSQELPKDWRVHSRQVAVPLELYLRSYRGLGEKLDTMTTQVSEAAIAFNLVRKVRGPEVFPNKGLYTGFEGFLVAYCSEAEVLEREREIGTELYHKMDKLKYPLKHQVRDAIEGAAFHPDAVVWLDRQLGVIIARLRCVGYQGQSNPSAVRANQEFRAETYRKLQVLPAEQRHVVTQPQGGVTTVAYPLPDKAVDAVSIPRTGEELCVSQIGMFGLPVFRALASAGSSVW